MSLPTGYGKSLCFGLLPRMFDLMGGVEKQSVVVIVSPLVALMKDQVDFSSIGISAARVSDEDASTKATRRAIRNCELQLIFISPEALFATLESRSMLCTDIYCHNLVGLVVDEAHCVKKW